ncbi:MAG: hypothetical protein GC146_12150 [Limimaricola sp.]|uniref:hypothetical protein n=1 Tax=Limimaricola sp. TaxID=2211665 RepID=UPI001DE40A35|nr:hypothetical protein [Limimaricola sp.]MBI1417966.1 hypothetical protein [Limimaricola sp.]
MQLNITKTLAVIIALGASPAFAGGNIDVNVGNYGSAGSINININSGNDTGYGDYGDAQDDGWYEEPMPAADICTMRDRNGNIAYWRWLTYDEQSYMTEGDDCVIGQFWGVAEIR